MDGDGVVDIAVGASGGSSFKGAVHISFLNSDGSVKSTVKIDDTTANGPSLGGSDRYGYAVDSLGDLDGDGVVDIAVGAINDAAGGTGRGAVHISFLNSDASVKSTVEINDLTVNGPVLADRDSYGTSLTSMGDLDGDGVMDIAVGAELDDTGGSSRGAVHISFLNSDGSVKSTAKIDDSTLNGPVLTDTNYFGSAVSFLGDINNNGLTDILVGSRGAGSTGIFSGAVFILDLRVPVSEPEIDLLGLGQSIVSGDSSPSTADDTDFGAGIPTILSRSKTFTINNSGFAHLLLGASPRVSISGSEAADFTVTSQPGSLIPSETSTTFEIEFDPAALGLRSALVTIENTDSDESSYTFAIQGTGDIDTDGDLDPNTTDPDDDNDGLSDLAEGGLGTDPLLADTDADGIEDLTELNEGTNPLDAGSGIERFGDEVCVEWNGFIDFLSQIFEIRNSSSADVNVDVTLFDIAGVAQGAVNFTLSPGIQRDVILNTLNGFVQNSYGLVCAKVVTGALDSLAGQLSTYRFTGSSYTLAAASSFLPFRTGNQFLTYNTFQPSLNFFDQTNFVANWAQVINDESTTETGTLRYYDAAGTEIQTTPLSLGAKQRLDIAIHSVGAFMTGLVAWEPDNASAKFGFRENRYYYGAAGLSELADAVSLTSKRGTGQILIAPFDTQSGTVALEISNTLGTDINVTTVVRDEAGALTAVQPALLTIGSKGTRGLVLNDYLTSGLGNIEIVSDTSGSMIVSIVEYGIAPVGAGLDYANPAAPTETLGDVITGSYNSFLGQACRARIANSSSTTRSVDLTMTRFDGTVLVNKTPVSVPANGAAEFDLCSNETQEAYGEVKIESAIIGAFNAEVLRGNSEGVIEFGSPMRP